MNYLFLLAHPDDEVDVGGTIYKLSKLGHKIAVAILVSKATARKNLSNTLSYDEQQSMNTLGVTNIYHGDFPNIEMNVIPMMDIIRFIESCVADWLPEAIVTHHYADVNIDHAIISRAAIESQHLYQTSEKNKKIRLFLMCESAGATEWSLDISKQRFIPNYFVDIGEDGLSVKLKAHSCYVGVSRSYPHPYSQEAYKGLAVCRGVQAGCDYAEAYQCIFRSSF